MAIDIQARQHRVWGWLRSSRRGFLGLAGGIWAVGGIYGLFTRPVPLGAMGTYYPDAGPATHRLLTLEFLVATALFVTLVVTERAERPNIHLVSPGARRIGRRPASAVWLMFGLLALQETGVAPFMPYIAVGDFPQTKSVALLAMWSATLALGAAAAVHTLTVVGSAATARPEPTVSPNRRKVPWALMIGAVVGITAAVPYCIFNWSEPFYLIA